MSLEPWNIALTKKNLNTNQVVDMCIQAAILAPSTHNSQPWELTKEADGVTVHDTDVRLPHSDPELFYHWISIGCFIENFAVCASFYGYDLTIKRDQHELRLKLKADKNLRDKDDLTRHIPRRYSEKRVFDSLSFPKLRIEKKGYGKSRIELFTDSKTIKEAAVLQYESARRYRDNTYFARELSSWLKLSKKHPVGMNHRSNGLSLPAMTIGKAALRITAKPLAKMAGKYLNMVNASNAVGFITAPNQTPDSLLDAGRTLERLSLLLTKHELSLTPLAAMVEDRQGRAYLQKLGKHAGEVPVMFFRVCDRKEPVYHTARKPYKMVVRK